MACNNWILDGPLSHLLLYTHGGRLRVWSPILDQIRPFDHKNWLFWPFFLKLAFNMNFFFPLSRIYHPDVKMKFQWTKWSFNGQLRLYFWTEVSIHGPNDSLFMVTNLNLSWVWTYRRLYFFLLIKKFNGIISES